MAPTRLLVATTNAGKLREIRDVLADTPVDIVAIAEWPPIPEPDETGATFADNARLKAVYYAAHVRQPTLAEDSGLVIDALDGEPGVRSARFLGPDARYADRFAEIERRLRGTPDAERTARFVCAVAVVDEQRVLFETTGIVEGVIARAPVGANGFGYDPIFYHPPSGATFAELTRDAKTRVSHRGAAFRDVAQWLRRG
jgi:XTP/dITP diphosphohydrolase